MLLRASMQDSLNVRLDEPDGSFITWGVGDPVDSDGWGPRGLGMVAELLPHIRQFVRVRQAVVCAEARNTAAVILEDPRMGVIHLDRRGRIMAVNDRAGGILRRADGLSDPGWGAVRPRAVRPSPPRPPGARRVGGHRGAAALSGAMQLHRPPALPPFTLTVHVNPVTAGQADYGARHVAALVLIVEPGDPRRVDPDLAARILELTPAESEVAVWLAGGKSVRDMAEATGRTKAVICGQLEHICRKRRS